MKNDKFYFNSDKQVEDFLNNNMGKIKRFEVEDSWYFRVHMNDGTYVELFPEYGAIYFDLKPDINDESE